MNHWMIVSEPSLLNKCTNLLNIIETANHYNFAFHSFSGDNGKTLFPV